MVVKAPNLKLLKKVHENKWVAFSRDYRRLLAVSPALSSLQKKIGTREAVVMWVLPFRTGYAPRNPSEIPQTGVGSEANYFTGWRFV